MSATAEALYQRHRLSVEDIVRMDAAGVFAPEARVELVEGEIIDMSPIGSAHAGKTMWITELFARVVGDKANVWVQCPVVLAPQTLLQPDLALLRRRHDFYQQSHPKPEDVYLIVEVADTSLRYDRTVKLPLYARAGIPEVWIVDLATRILEVHQRPAGKSYADVRTLREPEVLTPAALPDVAVDLGGVFGRS